MAFALMTNKEDNLHFIQTIDSTIKGVLHANQLPLKSLESQIF
jgi:hypothetical protein